MTALAFGGLLGPKHNSKIRRWESHAGYNIAEKSSGFRDPRTLAELAGKVMGMLMIPASGIVLILPNMLTGTSPSMGEAALLFAFVITGFALHRHADRGFRRKIQFDPSARVVRIGTLNEKERFFETMTFSADQVESLYIVRSKAPGVPARLMMRIKPGAKTVQLLEAPEKTLVPILVSATETMQPPTKNMRRVKTVPTGRFIRVSLG